MDLLEQAYMGGLNPGGMGILKRNSAQRADDREEAERLGRAAAQAGGADFEKKLRGVAEEFVTVFMNQVTKSMRANVPTNPAVHGDNGEKFFQDMLDTEYSGKLAKGSGYGLTDLVYQALSSKARIANAGQAASAQAEPSAEADAEAAGAEL